MGPGTSTQPPHDSTLPHGHCRQPAPGSTRQGEARRTLPTGSRPHAALRGSARWLCWGSSAATERGRAEARQKLQLPWHPTTAAILRGGPAVAAAAICSRAVSAPPPGGTAAPWGGRRCPSGRCWPWGRCGHRHRYRGWRRAARQVSAAAGGSGWVMLVRCAAPAGRPGGFTNELWLFLPVCFRCQLEDDN